MGSSQPFLSLHRSCNNSFASRRAGATKPSGSNNEATVERMPRVEGFSSKRTLNLSTSFSTSQATPSALSSGNSSNFKAFYSLCTFFLRNACHYFTVRTNKFCEIESCVLQKITRTINARNSLVTAINGDKKVINVEFSTTARIIFSSNSCA